MYTKDQWAVLSVLAGSLPKRPKLKTSDVAEKAFKKADSGDRRTRNAYRKLRAEGHIEIMDRGEYRVTPSGASFYKKNKDGFEPRPTRKRSTSVPAAKKKVAKKATKKAAKKVAKKAPAKKTAKRAPAKKATKKSPAKKASAKPNGAKASGKNGAAVKAKSRKPEQSSAAATLSF